MKKITHNEDLLFCYEAMKYSKKAVFTSEAFYSYCANNSFTAARKPFGDKQMTMLEVWDYIHSDGLKCFPELKEIINSQYCRNYIMCAMMAKRSGYYNPRLKHFLRQNLYNIFFSDLKLGYKLQAFRHCI